MTAFAAMLGTLAGDRHISTDAVYQPVAPSSPTVAVSVAMVDLHDAEISIGSAKANQSKVAIELRAVDVAQPAVGDGLTIAGLPYTVASFQRDKQRLVWRLMLREV